MGTNVRNEVSVRNPYHISKHRMLELKHFCLQYEDWKQEYVKLVVLQGYGYGKIPEEGFSDKVGKVAIRAALLDKKMTIVKKCCKEAGGYIWEWLFMGVTCGVSFGSLQARGMNCGKDVYYLAYRKFFWMLDKERG